MDGAQGPIITASAITWAAATAKEWTKNGGGASDNTAHSMVGTTVAVAIMLFFLFLIAEVNARLAIVFAWAICLGSLAVNGIPFFTDLQKLQSNTHSTTIGNTRPAPWQFPSLSIPSAGDVVNSAGQAIQGAAKNAINTGTNQGAPMQPRKMGNGKTYTPGPILG